jgi:hypothetical protein
MRLSITGSLGNTEGKFVTVATETEMLTVPGEAAATPSDAGTF